MSEIKKSKKMAPTLQLNYSKYNKDITIIHSNIINNSNSNNNSMFYTTKKRCMPLNPQIPEIPKHIIYYFDNKEKLEKLQSCKKQSNWKMLLDKKLKHISLNNSNEGHLNIESIMNPFKIKNYPSQRLIAPVTKMKSQSVLCNMNKTAYKPMSKSPISFNGYTTKNRNVDSFEILFDDRYSKKKLNVEDILINHKANMPNSMKSFQIKKYQLKQSLLLNEIKQIKSKNSIKNNNNENKLVLNGLQIKKNNE